MQPRRIGVDREGYIRKYVSSAQIRPPYTAVVSFIVTYIQTHCASQVHSVYLAGSVPAGRAIANHSDIDITLVVLDGHPTHLHQQVAELRQHLLATYAFLPKIDIVTGLYAEVTAAENRYGWGFWFQHCCACIYGEDVSQSIEPFRPSWQLVSGLNGDIKAYNYRVKSELLGVSADVDARTALCRSISRKYIRSAFCLVSVLEESYSDDLDVCVQLFLLYYPMHQETMQLLLEYAKRPVADTATIARVIDTFGVWLENMYASILQGDSDLSA